MTSSVHHVTFDSRDPYALAGFWAAVLGGRLGEDDRPGDPEVEVVAPGAALLFVAVPDGKQLKNRVHLDLRPDRPRDEEVERVLSLGAAQLDDRRRPDGAGWVVLADPEGNELCVTRSAAERGEPVPVDTGERSMAALHSAPERELLTGMLDWYRDGVVAKVEGMRQADAVTSPVRSGTNAAGLVKHLAYVEDSWLTARVGGRGEPEPWASAPFADDPDWEFHSATDEPLAASVAVYRAACERSRAVTAERGLDDTFVDGRGRQVSLRFVLLHLVEETARHLGHLDLLRELADGRTGD